LTHQRETAIIILVFQKKGNAVGHNSLVYGDVGLSQCKALDNKGSQPHTSWLLTIGSSERGVGLIIVSVTQHPGITCIMSKNI